MLAGLRSSTPGSGSKRDEIGQSIHKPRCQQFALDDAPDDLRQLPGWLGVRPAGALMEDDSGELAVRNPFRELTVFDGLEESGVA